MLTIVANMWFMRDGMNGGGETHQPIVFVNAQKIIDAKILEISMRSKGGSENEATAEGSEFAKRLQDVIAEYHDQGFSVIHGAALLSDNDEHDLTNATALKLGIDLSAKPGERERSK